MIYDWKIDKEYQFETMNDEEPFVFTISPDGKYLCFSENYGREALVYQIDENVLKCRLYLGRTISPVVNHGFFYVSDKLWYSSVRQK